MATVTLEIVPREPFRSFIKRKERWACIVAHRRAGKTVAVLQDAIKRAVEHKGREPRFAYIAPTYQQAKDVAWSYLKDYTAGIPGVKVSESELAVTLPHNGARIRLYGSDNYDRLRGLYLDGAIIDEAGDQDPRAWPEVIRPALSDRQGWATFIGTPKGRNAFHKIYQLSRKDEDWFSLSLPASETQLLPHSELESARKMMTVEQYAQEYECSFDAAIVGSYYGKDIEQAVREDRITRVPHDRASDVFAAWDLGIGDAMALWVGQRVGREVHFLRYYENSGEGLDHYVDWLKDLPFKVHDLLLPHDAEARELQTGKSRVEFLRARGFNCRVIPRHNVDDGINAVRMAFPTMWFDEKHCETGVDLLRMYRAEYDDKKGVLKPRPLHDYASHCADAMRCAVMGLREETAKVPEFKRRAVV